MVQADTQLPPLHTPPAAQLVPSGRLLHVVVLMPGWQLLQALPGSIVPGGYTVPPMSHCEPHTPLLQTCPPPHTVPLAMLLHAVVLLAGWHTWQELPGFAAPEG
jgi:hypothetical protein